MNLDNFIEKVEREALEITESLGFLSEGPRCLLLIFRKKDGGHTAETKRVFQFRVFYDKKGMELTLRQLLLSHYTFDQGTRIYLSVNRRDLRKSVRHMEHALLDAHDFDEENRMDMYRQLLKNPRTHLMQPQCKAETLFLFDIDRKEGRDIMGEAMQKLSEIGIEILYYRPTKNGWHVITQPFNPNLWDSEIGEIKKDGLLCLKY